MLVADRDQVHASVGADRLRDLAGLQGFHHRFERRRQVLGVRFAEVAGDDARRLRRHGLEVVTALDLRLHGHERRLGRRDVVGGRGLGEGYGGLLEPNEQDVDVAT